MPARQTLQAVGGSLGLGHGRPVDKDRDDANATLERGLNLDPHEIVRIVEPRRPSFSAGNPVPSNDRDKRVTRADAIGQDIEPINAKVDIVDVEEDIVPLQSLHHAIMDCARGEGDSSRR